MIACPVLAGEPHMIDFVELAPLGCKKYVVVFVIVVNHAGCISLNFQWIFSPEVKLIVQIFNIIILLEIPD